MEVPTNAKQPMNTNRRRRFGKRASLSNETMLLCPKLVMVSESVGKEGVNYLYKELERNLNELEDTDSAGDSNDGEE
jgi:hypothetical protein